CPRSRRPAAATAAVPPRRPRAPGRPAPGRPTRAPRPRPPRAAAPRTRPRPGAPSSSRHRLRAERRPVERRGRPPRRELELPEDVLHVALDRELGDRQRVCNLLVARALSDELEHLALAHGE